MSAAAKRDEKVSANAHCKAGGSFAAVNEKVNFSAEEQKVLKYWDEIKAFETSLKLTEGKPEYTFYDGPPFATGLPHYGHILAGTIKDTITRYASMTGHHVERRFGWDCHGLPVEYEIDQKLGIKSKDDVMKMGVAAYNAECRGIVTRYCSEWEQRVSRMGRWIDFKNDYKTMDIKFMESVWWVFKQLYDKKLVYRGFKVMPYSTACTTPLSNFEANLNYKIVRDPAVVISFPLVSDPSVSLLAWTTTPWTLPSNMACTVHPDLTYVKIKDNKTGAIWIVGETRLEALYPKGGQPKMGGADKLKDDNMYGDAAVEHVGQIGKSAKAAGGDKGKPAAADKKGPDAGKKDDKKAAADKKPKDDKKAADAAPAGGKKDKKKGGDAAAAPADTAAAPAGDDKKGGKKKGGDKPAADDKKGAAAAPADKKGDDKKKGDKKPAAAADSKDTKVGADGKPVKKPIVHDSKDYTFISSMKGKELKGLEYTPLFPYFADRSKTGAFRVLTDTYVTDDSGTGIVHSAPAFGEDDYRCCIEGGVIRKGEPLVCPIDASGKFTEEVPDWKGEYVKDADALIIEHLKKKGRLIHSSQIDHSYPFCWRSETPLLYRAIPSWFVQVESIKAKLVANNNKTYWVPDFVKEKRFHNWLQEAKDWAISRNRYWGTPLPIWTSEDGEEIVVIGSVEELQRLSGVSNITDLHKDKIDHITIPSKTGKGKLKRVEEVFDCWFESGSMPYAQQHYPFENKEKFDGGFPADFIAEGLDQTRGWFYTLMVISTGLFDKPPFRNLIVNGLVLAADGKKMSKRLKNYPDPMEVVGENGADALRVYLVNSPVVRAEPLRFQKDGVREMVKNVFLPWFHTYRFFIENAQRYETVHNTKFAADTKILSTATNVMDKWILASLQSLIEFVRKEMIPGYRLYTVVPRLLQFLIHLSNWYVRSNRKRAKGGAGQKDMQQFLATLLEVLLTLSRLMAPFTPFFAEMTYQNLKHALPLAEQVDSVHYLSIPTKVDAAVNVRVEQAVSRMQAVVELGRMAREKRGVGLKRPLRSITVVHTDSAYLEDVKSLESYVREELNVRKVELSDKVSNFILFRAAPNRPKLGKKVGGRMNEVEKLIATLTAAQINEFKSTGKLTLTDKEKTQLVSEDMNISVEFVGDQKRFAAENDGEVMIVLDCEPDAELIQSGLAREVVNRVQRLRKKAGLVASDQVEVFYSIASAAAPAADHAPAADVKDSKSGGSKKAKGGAATATAAAPVAAAVDALNPPLATVITAQEAYISGVLRRHIFPISARPAGGLVTLITETSAVEKEMLTIQIARPAVVFPERLDELKLSPEAVSNLKHMLWSRDYVGLLKGVASTGGKLTVSLDGADVTLVLGKHFFASLADLLGKKPPAA